jgi:hypothetical protein
MPQFESLTTGQSLATVIAIVALLGLAALLLTLLASIRFARFRALVCWSPARWINPDRFDEGSYLFDLALAIAVWLDPLQHRFTVADTIAVDASGGASENGKPQVAIWRTLRSPYNDYELGPHLGSSQAYQTYQTLEQDCVIKLAGNATGDRLLTKEAAVLDHLCRSAARMSYTGYLPQRIERFRAANHLAIVYPHDADRWISATHLQTAHPDGLDGEHIAWMFNRMLEIIGFAHRQGTIHCAVMPQHLLLDTGAHGLTLVDWTHAKRIGDRVTFIPRRYRKWYPQSSFPVAEPSLDIFMAARSALFLAGGDQGSNRIDCRLPKPMRQFLNSCLLESTNMRPRNAWELHEEFRDLLETLYGEARFHELSMPHEALLCN